MSDALIDLHTHSSASDGTLAPAELMRAATRAGLDVIALTDHDTTAGWREAVDALPPGLTLVRGAELSCVVQDGAGPQIPVHLLAYLFDPQEPTFAAERARVRESRVGRGRQIVERLAAAGLPVDWEQVRRLAAGAAVGRPHIARALVESGVAASVDEAFARYLHDGSPYYVPKADMDVFAAIRAVRVAGGVPVFAHPLARRRGLVVDGETIAAMAGAGLAGLEVDHIDHTPQDRHRLAALAGRLGLLTTGSSDFHGANKAVGLGAHHTDRATYDAMVEQTGGTIRPVTVD